MKDSEESTTGAVADTDGPLLSELALIASSTQLGIGVRAGPFTVIGREGDDPVQIGDRTQLEDHVLVEPGATIGADCVIEDHCRIGRGSFIAAGSRIRSGVRRAGDTETRHAAPSPATTGADAKSPVSHHALVASNATLGEEVEIDPFAIVGWEGELPVQLGARTKVSPFALIEPGVTIGEDCLIDAYCRIACGSTIGDRTQILYGAAVFENARIGSACIIGGNVADRTLIEDCVTHFGDIAHDYRNPGDLEDWDNVQAPSPTIKACTVIGQYAVIVGGLNIGPKSYIAAGEVVKVNVPAETLFLGGKMIELSKTRGLVRARTDGICS
jgi:UDP-3-O-[3-hydroxymyristoyl] glucosamine N-acyltransferase